jgi:hypothetical protein
VCMCNHGSPLMVVDPSHVAIPLSSARDRRGLHDGLNAHAGGSTREDNADATREEGARRDSARGLTWPRGRAYDSTA